MSRQPRVSHVPRPAPLLVSRPRLLDRLDGATPLTILRGPVGSGKTTLAGQWVAHRRESQELVVWLRVREGTSTSSFWAQAVEVALDAGLPVPSAAAGSTVDVAARLERALVISAVPVVMVVDGLQNAATADVERTLLDLVRHAPMLRLLVCVRGLRQLPPHRYLDLETTVVDAGELRFTEEEADQLLAVAGVPAGPGVALSVVEGADGWPELVRAMVLRLREAPATAEQLAGVVREIAVGHVHERLLADEDPPGRVEFALLTSLPEELTLDLAELLTEDPSAAAHLDLLDSAGLLTAESREGRTVHRWPSAVRQVLRDELERRSPELLATLHSRLARWYLGEQVIDRALSHAVDAEDWPLVIEIIEASWRVLGFRHNDELWRAMTSTPLDVLMTSPRALAVRDTKLPLDDDAFLAIASLPETDEELTALGRSDDAAEVLETCFALLTAWRGRGAIRQAQTYGDRTLTVLRAASGIHPDIRSLYPTLHLQVGLTHLLGGDVDAAIPVLRVAYDRGADNPLGYVEGDAAGKLALAHAFVGDLTQADIWLERHQDNARFGHTWLAPHIRTGGMVARLLVALDRLELAEAARAHDLIAAQAHREEFWAYNVHARAEYALTTGTAEDALDVLDRARVVNARWHKTGSLARPLAAAAEADLLLALGRANLARAVLAGPHGAHPLLRVAHARLALMTGQDDRVLQLTQDSQWERGAPNRHRLEMSLLRGVAAARVGDVELAVTVLDHAVGVAVLNGMLRPFTTVPRDELLALADRVPSLRTLLDAAPLAGQDDVYPVRVELIELSDREEQVLVQLATDLTIPEIADAAVLSYNTVRTQQRSLYKKLGTSDRGEAVARARQLGLLPQR